MIHNEEHFGQVLRRLRRERGYTLRDLDELANMSKSKIQYLEQHDGRAVSLEDAHHLDDVLQSGLTLVAAIQRDQLSALTDVARVMLVGPNRYTDLAVTMMTTGIEPQGVNAVDRRTFLQGASAGLAFPALALEATRHGVGIAMSERVDSTVDEWTEIVHEHGFGYMTTPPDEMLEALMIDVVALQYATTDLDDDDSKSRELVRVGALLCALTAMTLANLGRLREGRRWWRTSRKLADQSRDARTQAWVYGREIVRSLYEQRPIGAILKMVDQFESTASTPPQDSMLEFVTGKAQVLALAGRRTEATECLPQLEQICEQLPRSVTADGDSIFGWSMDRLKFTQSYVYSFIGDYPMAAKAQHEAIKLYAPTYVRGPAQIELQRAICLARVGDAAEAASHAEAVISRLAAGDRIRPIIDLGFKVLHSIPSSEQSRPEVRNYREFLGFTKEIEA